jgi:hypothetical protein
MKRRRLEGALATTIPADLAVELVSDFLQIRQDYATKTLGRAAPGKFVETLVQCLQHMARGAHEQNPKVDNFLDKQVESETALPDGLRVCAARVARSIYTLRNKRNIAHKNGVDPNTFDLAFIHQAAAWIMAELIRNATGITMQEAGTLIELVQAPVGTLVEEIDGTRLVHANVSIRGELLILLHSHHPERVAVADILASMKARSAGSVRNDLTKLRYEKLVHGDGKTGYRLTRTGHDAAVEEIGRSQAA